MDLDLKWRKKDHEFNQLRKEMNAINKEIGQKKKKKEACDDLIEKTTSLKEK